MQRPLRTAAFVLYNVVIVCVLIAGAEFAARAYFARKDRGTAKPSILLDRWAAFRNNPEYRRPWLHHTRQGFRRRGEVALAKAPNTIRIFLLGGSVAYGAATLYPEIDSQWQIGDRDTIDYFLEQELNAAFPDRHWEVINGAVRGYELHQDLALLLSKILRYKPDFVVFLDGMNDMAAFLQASEPYDAYAQTQLREEFETVANPRSFRSLGRLFSAWLDENSALYHMLRDRLLRGEYIRSRERQVGTRIAPANVRWDDLNEAERQQYRIAEKLLPDYLHVLHQIHAILGVDGIDHVFALQPHLLLTHKTPAGSEPRLLEYHREVAGLLEVYGFQTLYPELARRLAADSAEQKYRFLDLIGVFDGMNRQAFTDECHLTPDGDRQVADALFDQLKDSFRALKP